MISLPKPYDDELLYSVFARATAYLAPKHDYAIHRLLEREVYSVFFGTRLDELSENTRPVWGLSLEEILERHTMIPFYSRFVASGQIPRYREIMESRSKANIPTTLGLLNQNNVTVLTRLRFCRSCVLHDIATYGETYWRRSHQLNGALFCTIHSEVLKVSRAVIGKPPRPQDATGYIDIDSAPPCAQLTAAERGVTQRVSARCVAFLHGTPTVWGNAHLPSEYRRSAIALGHVEGTRNPNRVSQQRLALKFVDFYSRELLRKIGCIYESNSTWISEMFRQSSKNHFHPLFHALVQIFLEDAWAGCRAINAWQIRDARSGWKCPNPYALHEDHFRILAVEIRRRHGGRRYFSARCSCGYGFTFRHGCRTDPKLPEVRVVFAWGPYFEREARRLKDQGLSIRQIAATMKVGHAVATRLVQRKRSSFEFSQAEIRSWRKEWLRSRSKTLYVRLYRNDRSWLLAQPKTINHGGKGRQNNWSELDKRCAPLLASAIEQLKRSFPSRRISYLALEKETGVKSLKRKIGKMPTCLAILAKTMKPETKIPVSESVKIIRPRMIGWRAKQLAR
jgi:transposase-like protein